MLGLLQLELEPGCMFLGLGPGCGLFLKPARPKVGTYDTGWRVSAAHRGDEQPVQCTSLSRLARVAVTFSIQYMR